MFVAQLDLGPHAIRQHRSKRIAVNETRELFYAKRLSALTRRKESGSLVTCPARNGVRGFHRRALQRDAALLELPESLRRG
jgi:hypothetical protein